jgi:hypothetical protein
MGKLAHFGAKKVVYTAEGSVCSVCVLPCGGLILSPPSLAVHVQTLKLTKNPNLITRDDKLLGIVLKKKKKKKKELVQTKVRAPLELQGSGREAVWTDEYLMFGCTIYFNKKGEPQKKEYKLQVISVGHAWC